MLPVLFKTRMKELLNSDYNKFINSFNEPNIRGIRYNKFYLSKQKFVKLLRNIEKIPYDDEGYYLTSDIKLGNHPFHQAGIFYLQDPAAMVPINCIDIKSNYNVLDLCAAPGGKTFQIATKLTDGLLMSNEINMTRNKVLQQNIERLGLKNIILTSMDSKKINKYYKNSFDVVLVDAPCSGEGMFRKYPEAVLEWSQNEVIMCAERQLQLLNDIAVVVKENGYIIYSTCTYSLEENEIVIDKFLSNKDFILIDPLNKINEHTVNGYIVNNNNQLTKTKRFYPHLSKGEGQFVAVLKRVKSNNTINDYKIDISLTNEEQKIVDTFLDETIGHHNITTYKYNNNIVTLNLNNFKFINTNIVALGVKIGEIKNGRIIPHHHFFKSFGLNFTNKLNLSLTDKRLKLYLEGNIIVNEQTKNGFGIIMLDACPLGGYKAVNGVLKNHYPKGLRTKNND